MGSLCELILICVTYLQRSGSHISKYFSETIGIAITLIIIRVIFQEISLHMKHNISCLQVFSLIGERNKNRLF